MITEHEHEIVSTIRGWLAATSGVEVPTGLSCEEAHHSARRLLAEIVAGCLPPRHVDTGDDLQDILWALVRELNEKPLGLQTFEACDRVYQFVTALPTDSDFFDERNQILHRLANIGWRSAPGGVEAALRMRAIVWEQGDGPSHREASDTAHELTARIEVLKHQRAANLAEVFDVCSQVLRMANFNPKLETVLAADVFALLGDWEGRIGHLDECEFLKGVAASAIAMGNRQLEEWKAAASWYAIAEAAFRRTVSIADLDRIRVERLALLYLQGRCDAVVAHAPALVGGASFPRERIKAALTLGAALVDLNRAGEAIGILQAACSDPMIGKEPVLKAWAIMKLGNAYSDLGNTEDAMANFARSGAVLARHHYPMLLATLMGSIGECLAKCGHFEEAAKFHATSRGTYRQIELEPRACYQSVLLAELLVILGRNGEAEAELVAVLPVIERFGLRREAVAAAALLHRAAKRDSDVNTKRTLRDQLRKGLNR